MEELIKCHERTFIYSLPSSEILTDQSSSVTKTLFTNYEDGNGEVSTTLDPPLNFNHIESTVDLLNNKYNAIISWLPPISNGLSILKYKLSWGKSQSPSIISMTPTVGPQTFFTSEYKISLPPHRLTFTITDLDINFNYWVKLQVIYSRGHEKLKSGKSKIIVNSKLRQPNELLSHDYQLMYRSGFNSSFKGINMQGQHDFARSQGPDDDDDDDDEEDDDVDYELEDSVDEYLEDVVGYHHDNQFVEIDAKDRKTVEKTEKVLQVSATAKPPPLLIKHDGMLMRTPSNRESTHHLPINAHPTPIPVTNVRFETPYFHNGLVRCHVSWKLSRENETDVLDRWPEKFLVLWLPENCSSSDNFSSHNDDDNDDDISGIISVTTQETSFTIYDLWYECDYRVSIRSVSKHGVLGTRAENSVSVPECGHIVVVGSLQPQCHKKETSDIAWEPHSMDPPTHLRHSYVIRGTNITAKLFWNPPLLSHYYHGYLITWFVGEPMRGRDELMTYVNSTTVEKNKNMVCISGLLESRSYEVKVQTVSRTGVGDPAIALLKTPGLENIYANDRQEEIFYHGIHEEVNQSNDDYDFKFKFERTNRQLRNRNNGVPATIDFMKWPSPIIRSSSWSSSSSTLFTVVVLTSIKCLML